MPLQLLDSDRFAVVLVACPIPFSPLFAGGGDAAAVVVAVVHPSVTADLFLAPFRVYSVPSSDLAVPFLRP